MESNYVSTSAIYDPYLVHSGIKGMKWGIRRYQNPDGTLTEEGKRRYGYSIGTAYHRALSNIYKINEKTYKKLGNKTLESMNRAAKEDQLKKARDASAKAVNKKVQKNRRDIELRNVNPELAKNRQTKRAAYDYHNLDDRQFKFKYKTNKKTFAKRYLKSEGNTYGMGLRKAAIASFIVAHSPDISYTDLITGKRKTIKNGKSQALKAMATDVAYSEIAARVGYKKAEEKYNSNK